MADSPLQEWRPPGDAGKAGSDEDVQKVFDTVTGPNLRLADNLIQLGVIVAGTILGAAAGAIYARTSHSTGPVEGAILGGFAGLVLSLLFSGLVIGVVRAILAARR
jgi:hypothetical protein